MNLFNGFNASASALTANRLRMDVVSSNIANAETTRSELVDGEWQPYKRKVVELEENSFESKLQAAMGNESPSGVKVSNIQEDNAPNKLVYNPAHPDANEEGYVEMPNVDMVKEMVDLMSASRSYEANVTALNATKSMYMKALELGK
ncbi:flagellar basal body rod protein FlgC [Pseudalkalibacillus hwajinpoensis]|uniref:flagellar basal body rod protein FlgC n=1 Tax=Guptibacillus hwajinpoensis TaxID=208199 RepID=UPI001CD77AC8|nr:flagellar basal body rod protein FlgC [Pseudalkalibacillus hwajinpoensis]MCA0991134.1 flagellar basal body rod protein FlgC [Pseudalkalibacillus hwajinpoensis]